MCGRIVGDDGMNAAECGMRNGTDTIIFIDALAYNEAGGVLRHSGDETKEAILTPGMPIGDSGKWGIAPKFLVRAQDRDTGDVLDAGDRDRSKTHTLRGSPAQVPRQSLVTLDPRPLVGPDLVPVNLADLWRSLAKSLCRLRQKPRRRQQSLQRLRRQKQICRCL